MAEESLFRRLTKLFRSGPTVKRKVRQYSKSDSNASSAVELFKKNHSDVYNSTLSAYGTFDRMARYSDFSEMESTPEIASALDIYAEECASQDVEGRCLHVYSENRKISELLETLFYDTLNVNFNLVMWIRNLVKYGDFFIFNDVHPEYGVINAYPIPITEMEREEGYDADDPSAVRFRWITQGNQILENWQVTHFRLLGNDAFLPYGSSVLESARRIWRQLILIEDAMMVYRVIRAPERRVFYIDVGNVPPEDVPNYLEQAKTALKANQVVNKTSGQVDLRYNPLSVDEDYFLPVRGGDSGTRIDTLAGGTNASAIEDVEYIQKKLFAALKIPKAYLGYDEEIGAKATLAQEDIRFSRAIQRIQKTIIAELNKIAMIHLYAHGFEGEDLLDFTLQLSNPSSLAQQQKLELIRTKFEIAAAAPEGMVSKTWILKTVFGFTRDQINQIKKEQLKDKVDDLAVENAQAPGSDAGGDDAGGDDGGDEGGGLFAGDVPSGINLLDGNPLKASKGNFNEADDDSEDEFYDEYDEIDLDKISGEVGEISPNNKVRKNAFGGELKTKDTSRKVHSGPESLHMPDFMTMLSTGKRGRGQDSLNKPYDEDFLKNPLGNFTESSTSLADLILGLQDEDVDARGSYEGYRPSMDSSLKKSLENMDSKFGKQRLIIEQEEGDLSLLNEEYELDLEEDDE